MTNKRYGRVGDSPHHRRRHLRQRRLRGLRDRLGRVLHPRRRRPRHLRAHDLSEGNPAAGRRSRDQPGHPQAGRRWRGHRAGRRRHHRHARSTPKACIAAGSAPMACRMWPCIRTRRCHLICLPVRPSPEPLRPREPERVGWNPARRIPPDHLSADRGTCPVDSARTTGRKSPAVSLRFDLAGWASSNLRNPEGYPSGQRGQTVNLLAYAFGGSNPPPSTSSMCHCS